MKNKKHSPAYLSFEEGIAAKRAVRDKLRNFRWILALKIAGLFAGLAILYYVLLAMQYRFVTPVLYIGALVMFLVFFFLNRGLSGTVPTAEQLPPSWSDEKKRDYIEEDTERKALAKKLMFYMVPVLLLVAVDILSVLVVPMLS